MGLLNLAGGQGTVATILAVQGFFFKTFRLPLYVFVFVSNHQVLSGGHQKHELIRLLSCPPPACYRAAKHEKQRLHLVSTASDGSVAVWDNHFTGNIVEGSTPSATLVVQESSSEALVS
jgi:hypothetical protein